MNVVFLSREDTGAKCLKYLLDNDVVIGGEQPDWLFYAGLGTLREQEAIRSLWASWTSVPAVANGHIYSVSADLVSRPSLRILDGLQILGGIVLNDSDADRTPIEE